MSSLFFNKNHAPNPINANTATPPTAPPAIAAIGVGSSFFGWAVGTMISVVVLPWLEDASVPEETSISVGAVTIALVLLDELVDVAVAKMKGL